MTYIRKFGAHTMRRRWANKHAASRHRSATSRSAIATWFARTDVRGLLSCAALNGRGMTPTFARCTQLVFLLTLLRRGLRFHGCDAARNVSSLDLVLDYAVLIFDAVNIRAVPVTVVVLDKTELPQTLIPTVRLAHPVYRVLSVMPTSEHFISVRSGLDSLLFSRCPPLFCNSFTIDCRVAAALPVPTTIRL